MPDENNNTGQTPQMPPMQQAPVAPQAPVPPVPQAQHPQPAASKPGEGLAIASLVLSLIGFGLVGLIFGLVSFNETKKVGHPKNGMAVAGVIISALQIAIVVIIILVAFVVAIANTSTSTI